MKTPTLQRIIHAIWMVSIFGTIAIPNAVFATPILGADLASFAVLGGSGVTSVSPSTIGGNLGAAPNASVGGGYVFTSGSLQADVPVDSFVASTHGLGIDNLMNFYKLEQSEEENTILQQFIAHTQLSAQVANPY